MDFTNKIIETYQKMLGENKFVADDILKENYEVFANHFGPDKLKGLDGELLLETLFNHSNKGSLVYWLEFKNDDEFQTNRFVMLQPVSLPIVANSYRFFRQGKFQGPRVH